MLQRLARSQVSSLQFWESLSSALECSGVCRCTGAAASGPAAEKSPIRNSLEYRLKQQVNIDMENFSQPSDPRPVHVGLLIERYPICFPELAPWRAEHREWSSQWNSWKYRQVTDEEMSGDKQNVDEASAEATFHPEPRLTEADRDNDIRSLRRSTQGYLYLSCRYGYADDSLWEIPKTPLQEGETLREAAQRCMREIAGDSIETFIFANSPSGHTDSADARTFYMLGVVLDGDVVLSADSPAADYAWLKRSELAESYTEDKRMSRIVRCLLEE